MLRVDRCEGDGLVARSVPSTKDMHEGPGQGADRPDVLHPAAEEERDAEASAENELSLFLIAYLLALLGSLLLVHLLQPEREGSGSSSRSPTHQERLKAE